MQDAERSATSCCPVYVQQSSSLLKGVYQCASVSVSMDYFTKNMVILAFFDLQYFKKYLVSSTRSVRIPTCWKSSVYEKDSICTGGKMAEGIWRYYWTSDGCVQVRS